MRWWRFNAVGALGWLVQTAVLTALVHIVRMHYLLATALAVEGAVLHNFLWHCRWTWADRPRHRSLASALLLFHLSNGSVSIAGNLAFMRILVGAWHGEPVLANVVSVVLCSLLNFLLADRFVFQKEVGLHCKITVQNTPG
jgi:putative flippase GtrA